jgi:hypothetical protein
MQLVLLRTIILLAALVRWIGASQGQDTRAETAPRTAALERAQAAMGVVDLRVAQAEADLGLQEGIPVAAAPSPLGPYIIGNAGLFYTSNPSLSKDGGRGDLYFVGGGGAGLRPHLAGGLFLDAHVSDLVFQYAQFSSLNFNYFNAGGGLDYVFENLGQLTASVRYEYQRYLDGGTLDEFYVNNALTTALFKQFQIIDTMAIQLGWLGSFSLTATPSSARRHENDFWLGWRWRLLTPLELQTFYILSLFYYPHDSRLDVTQNVGVALTLSLTRWASLTASTGFGANNSTDSFFDYTVVTAGGTLALDVRF